MAQERRREDFARVIASLAETIGTQANSGVVEIYWRALQDLEPKVLAEGLTKMLTTETNFFGRLPAPGLIRKYALGDPAAKAATAWQVISDKIKCGAMPMIDYTITDPIAHAALKSLGGHSALGQAKPEEFDTWARKRFIDAYVAIAAEPIPEGLKGPIRGQCSMEMRGGVCWEHVTLNLETGEIIPKALSQGSEKFKALVAGVVENTSHE